MNSWQQAKQQRAVKQTALMSKSRKNYQSGTYSRISNRYNSIEDSLTEDEPADAQAQPQAGQTGFAQATLHPRQPNGDSLTSNSNFGNMSSQVSPPSLVFGTYYSSKRNSTANQLNEVKSEVNRELNSCYYSQAVPGLSATLCPQRNNPFDEIRCGTGSFDNNSCSEHVVSPTGQQYVLADPDDCVKIFHNGGSGLMNIGDDRPEENDATGDEENVSDDDEPRSMPESAVLQEIPAVLCMDAAGLNSRRSAAMYSFTKNIDYSQITDQQKRRFLREKKSYAKNLKKLQQIVPDPSSVKSSMTAEEKENQVCSEFGTQNVKFVSRNQPIMKSRAVYREAAESKPKSILKQAGSGANKTCIQNNVYQSAQFVNKQNKLNLGKKGQSKGRQEAAPGHMNHHANIDILDQRQAQVIQRAKRQEYAEVPKKVSKAPGERSGSKKNRRPNTGSKFTCPVQMRKDSRSKLEAKRPSQILRKTSPTVASEGPVAFPNGRRGSTKSMQETFSAPKFANYDVKAHRNVWDQYGKREAAGALNRKLSGNQGQRKQSQKPNAQMQSIRSPRDALPTTLSRQAIETEKQVASTKSIATAKQQQSTSKTRLRKQKSLERASKATEKSEGSASLLNMRSLPSGYLSARETNSLVERAKSRPKQSPAAANAPIFLTSLSEQSLPVSKTDNRKKEQQQQPPLAQPGSVKQSRPSLPAAIHTNGNPKLSMRQANQTQKVRSIVQIDLVDQEQDGSAHNQQESTNQRSRESTGLALPLDPSLHPKGKRASNASSSYNGEQRTARGSAVEPRGSTVELKEGRKRLQADAGTAKIEDPQQEKYKIWMMHSVDEQNEAAPTTKERDHGMESVSDPFRHQATETKFTLTESEVDPLNQRTAILDANDRSQGKCDMALTSETDLKLPTCESLPHHPRKHLQGDGSNDKNLLGPQRGSKINRRSKQQRNDELRDGQLSVHDVMTGVDEKSLPGGQSASALMDNHEYEEFQQLEAPCGARFRADISNDDATKRAAQPLQEEPSNPHIDIKTVDESTPNMNKTVNERTLRQHLLLEGKSGGGHEQSLSEITQFHQRDFQSSNLDDTNVLNGQSRNVSTTMPSAPRNQTQSTIPLTSRHASPDHGPSSRRRTGAAAPVPAAASSPLNDDVILMINERSSDPAINVEVTAKDEEVPIGSADRVLEAVGSGTEKKHSNTEQPNLGQQMQSPSFGGLSSKVELQQSVQNSGRQSLPNSVPQSSSGLDSTRIIEEDGQLQNPCPAPAVSQYSTGNPHSGACQCADCFQKQDQIQQRIEQIPFEIYGAPGSHRSSSSQKVNFDALLEQHLILQQIRDLIEIRPSTVQNYSNLKSSFLSSQNGGGGSAKDASLFDPIPCTQAIEGLTVEERIKIQTLCQEWWDSTQEDSSVFKMALAYQQDVQEAYFRSSMQDQVLSVEERNVLNSQNYERSQCMRKQVVLSSVVIGMTAFFSMLTRHGRRDSTIVSCDSTVKQDLELRTRLSQLIKILYDQSMLCMSYALGKLAKYERVTKNRSTAEFKLHSIYNEYIHLLFINKKIQTEDDYQIFNHRGLMPQYPPDQYINNEENRDFQLGQLSRRLQDNCYKIVEQELVIQTNAQSAGNVDLLYVLRDIVEHSADIDFQEGKNHIFEGISNSEALLNTNNVSGTASGVQDEEEEEELVDLDGGAIRGENDEQKAQESAVKEMRAACQGAAGSGGQLLVKTFKDDVNQIIQEESREESMSVSVSMINSSKIPPEAEGLFSHSVSLDRSRMLHQGRTPKHICNSLQSQQSQQTQGGDVQQDFDRMIEIQENVETEQSQKNDDVAYDSLGRKTLKLDDTDLRVQEPLRTSSLEKLSNDPFLQASESLTTTSLLQIKKYIEAPQFVRVSHVANSIQEGVRAKAPYLPPLGAGKKYTLVLDLEETLIHCTLFSKRDSTASNKDEGEEDLLVYQRPGLQQFLKEMAELYEIVIFTSKGEECANQLVKKCVGTEYVDHILHQDHLTILNAHEITKIQDQISEYYRFEQICSSKFGSSYLEPCEQLSFDRLDSSEGAPSLMMASPPTQPNIVRNIATNDINLVQEDRGNYIKDLSKIGRDLSRTIIVDNRAENFGWHLQNGICISEYIFDRNRKSKKENDQSLPQLSQLLRTIFNQAEQISNPKLVDVRSILNEHLQQRRDLKQNKYFY